MRHSIVLFGEAEKGQFQKPYHVNHLGELIDALGNPPLESEGLLFAVQSLLYHRKIIYFRVEEEGFSNLDYFRGFHYLQNNQDAIKPIHALCLPGVGSAEILNASEAVRQTHHSILITNQKDLYDYLTSPPL